MKYNVSNRVIINLFVMLLINLKSYKIDECKKVNEEIKKLYVIVKRDKRENLKMIFNFNVISIHEINNRNVVDVANVKNKINNTIVTIDVINKIKNKIDVENVKSEINLLLIRFSNFVCFVRTCL